MIQQLLSQPERLPVARPRLSPCEQRFIFGKLGMHKGYQRLTPRQRLVIDYFSVGMGYVEIGKELSVCKSRVYYMLRNQILPRYKPTIWRQTDSLAEALRIVAAEVTYD